MAFIKSAKQPGCIFCGISARSSDLRERLVLAVTKHSVVMLNRYPYNNGHLMIAPRRHTNDFDRLSATARVDLAETLRRSITIVRRALRPDGMNVGLNLGQVAGAGIADHLHWHIVPRWSGDTNYMPVIADTKVMPQHLHESYDALASRFARLR